MTEERWLPVVGHEEAYEVSDSGKVRSKDRYLHFCDGRGRMHWGRELKQSRGNNGYLFVTLWTNNQVRIARVHHLVAEAFIGPRPDGALVLHGPGANKDDNRASNLHYGTSHENSLDRQRDGNDFQRNKQVCPRGHLLEAPNLGARHARLGHRTCLACNRGHGIVTSALRHKGLILSFEKEADKAYRKLMAPPKPLLEDCERATAAQCASNVEVAPYDRHGKRNTQAFVRHALACNSNETIWNADKMEAWMILAGWPPTGAPHSRASRTKAGSTMGHLVDVGTLERVSLGRFRVGERVAA